MKSRLLVVAGIAIAAALALWLLVLRGHGHRAKPTRGPVAAGPAAGGFPGARPEGPDRGRAGGPPAPLVDDDPAGSQRLEGLVLTAAEQPVAGAIVSLSSNPPRTTTTETDGSFSFDGLVGRPYTLVARAPAGVAGPITAKAGGKTSLIVLHLRAAGAVTVDVVDGKNKPVANATVELRGLDRQSATTAADGIARFAPVVPGPYDVAARAAGYAPSFAFRPVPTGEVELTVVLRPGAAVSGKVVDADGKPVEGARVLYVGASDWGVRPDDRLDGALTAADGTWRFDAIGAGSYRFVARHPAHAPGTSPLVSLDGVTPKGDIVVTLAAGATVRGKVVDTSQQPVASAQVRLGAATRGMIAEPPRQVTSADDGTFVVEGLPRAQLSAVAISESAASKTVPVDTSAGDVNGVVLTVDVTGVIAGIVVDRAGEPQDGVQVTAAPDFRSGNVDLGQLRLRGFIQDLTDSGGRFELVGLAEGSYLVRATRTAQGPGRAIFGDGGESAKTGTRDLRIVLPADGGVKGKVAFADGTAPVAFSVSVGFGQDQSGGKDGAFELDGLEPHGYRIAVQGLDFDDKTVDATVEEGKVTDLGTITVVKGRRIAGRVTYQGAPVPNATVWAGSQIMGTGSSSTSQFNAPGITPPRTATTGDDGTFSIGGLGPSPVAVVAEQDDLGRSPARRVVRGAADEQSLELVLAPFGSLAGTVHDPGGDRHLVTVQSTTTPNAAYTVMSGADGAYRLDKLAPDTYKASAMLGMPFGRGGMQLVSQIVTVVSGAEAHADLEIDKGPLAVTVIAVVAGGTAGQGSGSGTASGSGGPGSGGPGSGGNVIRGAAWLVPGTITARTADQLSMASAGTGGRSGLNFLIGGRADFADLQPGTYTACVGILPREVPQGLAAGQEYFRRHSDTLPVSCVPASLPAAPTEQTISIPTEIPPYDPS
ncbi:MAG TPA: carboxypeptidase regulatory-like domain-containing protein [Kofleriaceae bacterium]|nr:carboxypeptidase regulatory-like domain-containing protein [Kofleriaceae bacterium]